MPGPPSRSTTGPFGEGVERGGSAPRGTIGGPTEGAAAAGERVAAGRGAPAAGQGFLPLGGVAGRTGEQDHRRPNYLVDDTDAFADDRWFTPPVIGGEDPEIIRA